ncbi:hypothetical protein [Microcystis sp.]|uniref:hypothetical protein n=1 Tax=Microcystis sp. TaxID=1127 RepID=UPI00391D26EA
MTIILISSTAKEDLESINNRIAYSNLQDANQLNLLLKLNQEKINYDNIRTSSYNS